MAQKPLASSRVSLGDSLEEITDHFYRQGYTDGLPIVPPTEERVRRFVAASGREPDEVVGVIPPAMGEATVEKIAVNAVMAGCLPEYMPVLLAAVEALCDPAFNLTGIQATTNPATPLLVLNGPVRQRLEVNSGAGCFGPGWRANATLGRAVRLILLNLGGGKPGEVDKSTHGFPGKYTFCFAENEEESPWEPLSVERGFGRGESTVTVVGAHGTSNILEQSPFAEDLLKSLASGMVNTGCNNFVHAGGEPLLVLSPPHAHILAEAGFTKARLKEYLWEHARAPLDWFSSRTLERIRERGAVADGHALITSRPENIMVVVAGGPGGLHSAFIPTFGDTRSVTRPVRLP